MSKAWNHHGAVPVSKRLFHEVARDVRNAVFAVVRIRRNPDDNYGALALGSGFFVSHRVFVTCHHVLNGPAFPHLPGDSYMLVNSSPSGQVTSHTLRSPVVGESLYFLPGQDCALMVAPANPDQAFLKLDYDEPKEGMEIGVAGYPLPQLTSADGHLQFGGIVYRVAKGPMTAVYPSRLSTVDGIVRVLEFNYLFVNGNSGGPLFHAETGRALGYVHGYNSIVIHEQLSRSRTFFDSEGRPREYVTCVNAIYSLGLPFGPLRNELERLDVSL